MALHRRTLLRRTAPLVAGVATAGCTAIGDSSDPEPTETTDETPTGPTPGDCSTESDVDESVLPEKPSRITEETALAFAMEYETARARAAYGGESVESVNVSVTDENVRTVDDGFVVRFEAVWVTTEDETDATDATADDAWSADYLVTDSVVERAQGPARDSDADATERDAVVCW